MALEELYLILWKRAESALDLTIDYFKRRARSTRDDPDVDARNLLATFMGIKHELDLALAQNGIDT